jgi:D-ribose pyranose/furanose isomerase RbsD
LENHPKIQSQTMNLAYKLEEYRYKKTYYPDPRFGIMWSTVPYNKKLKFEFDKSPMSGIEYSLIQPIPTPGKLTLESKITEKEIELERIKLAEEYNKTTEKILMLWASYYASKELDLILNQYYDKFKTLTESSKAKYTTGKGNYTDLSKAILLENKLKEERIAIKGNIENLKENLNYYYSIINKTNYEESTYYDSNQTIH